MNRFPRTLSTVLVLQALVGCSYAYVRPARMPPSEVAAASPAVVLIPPSAADRVVVIPASASGAGVVVIPASGAASAEARASAGADGVVVVAAGAQGAAAPLPAGAYVDRVGEVRSEALEPGSASAAVGGAPGAAGPTLGASMPANVALLGAQEEAAARQRVTGAGRGLRAVAGEGVTVDGRLAALALLGPLGGLDTGGFTFGDVSLFCRASLAHDALRPSGGDTDVVVRVRGGQPPGTLPPLRVHLVIDASTSMESTWGQLQDAARALVARLRPEDELQLVVYGTDAREVRAPRPVGDGRDALAVIDTLRASGRTNIEAGLRVAYGTLRPHASLVILLSDGVPNGGLSTPDELGRLAAQAVTAGAVTTAIGIGWDFHPGVLRALAGSGHGHFRIAPRTAELGPILEAELAARGRVAAHDVTVDVQLAPGVVLASPIDSGLVAVPGGVRLVLPALASGEEKVLLVPVHVAAGRDVRSVAAVRARWQPALGGPEGQGGGALEVASGPVEIVAGAGAAVLDADLAEALAQASVEVTGGDGRAAAARLEAHVMQARAMLAVRPGEALASRTEAVAAIATALSELVARASWPDRRATGASMMEASVRIAAR